MGRIGSDGLQMELVSGSVYQPTSHDFLRARTETRYRQSDTIWTREIRFFRPLPMRLPGDPIKKWGMTHTALKCLIRAARPISCLHGDWRAPLNLR